MPQRVPALQLPLPASEAARESNRQLNVWSAKVVSVINSLSADPGFKNSGTPGSAVTTLLFSGSSATINISGLMHFVEGGVSLANIKEPEGFSGMFFLIAASAFELVSGGNIVVPSGNVLLQTGEMVPMVFDGKNWYASIPVASNLLNVKIITFANSPYSVAEIDYFIVASSGTAADTIVVLPSAIGSGRPLDIKKIDANPYSIAITPANTDTIDDESGPFKLLARYASYTLVDYSPGKWAIL